MAGSRACVARGGGVYNIATRDTVLHVEEVDAPSSAPTYCLRHPRVETVIRCSKCLDPICPRCGIRTPVGLRCPDCVRAVRSPLYVLDPQHYVLAVLVALSLSTVLGGLVPRLGLLFVILLAGPAGGLVGEAVLRSTHGKRGRPVQIVVAICLILGALLGPYLWQTLMRVAVGGSPGRPVSLFASLLNISTIVYVVLATGAAVARLR